MNSLNDLKDILEANQQTDYLLIVISFLFCAFSSFLLMYVYKNKSNSLSSKNQIASIIPLISSITFLVILIVKSSLALSLGLVGALSVIRFRTPVKEPEDLAYLFLSIGLGIGYGALQIYATSIIFILIVFIIWFFLYKKIKHFENDFNLIIESDVKNFSQNNLDDIIKYFKETSDQINFLKVEKDSENLIIYFRLQLKNFDNIKNILSILNTKFPELKFSMFENKIIN
jgi:hypothetical protein